MTFIPICSQEDKSNEKKMKKKCFDCRETLKHTSFKIKSRELNGISGVSRASTCYSCAKTKYPPRISYSELQEKVLLLYDIIEDFETRISNLEESI